MRLKNSHIIIYIFCFLLICYLDLWILYSQEATSYNSLDENATLFSDRINEKIYLHTDRLFYLSGERIWFRIYLLVENTLEPIGFSRVAYVELLNNRDEVISRQKIKIDHSGGSGYLDIPRDSHSGYYFIRSYTHWMKNYHPAGYFMTALAIVNPAIGLYEKIDSATISSRMDMPGRVDEIESEHVVFNKPKDRLDIKINDNNLTYKCRKKVDLEISTTGVNGNPHSSDISVSVFYSGDQEFHTPDEVLDSLTDQLMITGGLSGLSDNGFHYGTGQKYLYYAEMEGITVSGCIIDPSIQNPVSDVPVYLSIVQKNAFLKSCLTHQDGRFYFSLGDIYGENDVILSYGNQTDDLLMILDEPYSDAFTELPDLRLNLDENWRSFIEKQMINSQLNSVFTSERESYKTESNHDQQPFYVKPDFTIRMEDFIRLPNMEEVFRELVKQVLVTRESGQLKLNVLDYNTNRIIGPKPVFILDGVSFFDSGLIFELNPEDIAQIDIVSHKYYKGILEMDGIIDIRTNKGNLPISELPGNTYRQLVQAYQTHQEYKIPDYSDEEKLKSRIPDFRNLLYWNPSVRTDPEGKVNLSFYTSDNTGLYVIRIKGISDDGLIGSAKGKIMVIK